MLRAVSSLSANQKALGDYTYATLPAAASFSGYTARVTDIGVPCLWMVSDGTRWVPAGPQVLGRGGVAASGTSTTNEEARATIAVPANLLGLSGGLRITTGWSCTSSANIKTMRVRLGGIAGSALGFIAYTTVAGAEMFVRTANRNSASSQFSDTFGNRATDLVMNTTASLATTVDTTAAQDLVISGQKATAGETLTLEYYSVEVLP